jgi:AcrR family transcriptional regulator
MPRRPDSTLEARILNASRKLWIKGGDEALSMRAVARAAKSNTPAIYRRFRNRKEILRALLRRAQLDLYEVVKTCESPEQVGLRTFEFAMARQREYQLITAGLIGRINEPQPVFEFVKKRCGDWFGGSPEDYTQLVAAVWSAVHGTALLLITKSVPRYAEAELRSALPVILEVLVRNRAMLGTKG